MGNQKDNLKLQTAKLLYQEGHKEVARDILVTSDHTQAKKRLERLPDKQNSSTNNTSIIIVAIVVSLLFGVIGFAGGWNLAPRDSDIPAAIEAIEQEATNQAPVNITETVESLEATRDEVRTTQEAIGTLYALTQTAAYQNATATAEAQATP